MALPIIAAAATIFEKHREPEGRGSVVAFFWFLFLAKQEKKLGRRDELLASAVKDVMVAIDQAATSAIGALKLRKRKALPSTNTLDSAMAPAAKIGDSRTPYAG